MQLQIIIAVAAEAKVVASDIQMHTLVKSLNDVNRKHVQAYSKIKRHGLLRPVYFLQVVR
jgi:hypothetical protein